LKANGESLKGVYGWLAKEAVSRNLQLFADVPRSNNPTVDVEGGGRPQPRASARPEKSKVSLEAARRFIEALADFVEYSRKPL
jgi:hypothetical protein